MLGLAQEASSLVEVLAEEKQQRISVQGESALVVSGDRLILRQALINLIDNAIKYSPSGSEIVVQVHPGKDSEVIVETIFGSIVRSLHTGDKIEIRGFGSFRTRQRKPRIGRNPKTGDRVEVPAKKIPFFKPSKELKDLVNTSSAAVTNAPAGGAAPTQAAPVQ